MKYRISTALEAVSTTPTAIDVFRLKPRNGNRTLIATLTIDGKLHLKWNYNGWDCSAVAHISKLLPPSHLLIVRQRRPYWARSYGEDYEKQYDAVLVPYAAGDHFDTDANYLHAQNAANTI